MAALFAEGLSNSAEWELAIDETASTVSLAPNVCVAPGVSAAVQENEKFVEVFGVHLSVEESAERHFDLEGEAEDNDSFVDIMRGTSALGDAESEGWTFADALAYANLSVETLPEGIVDTSRMPTCYSSFFISYYLLV